MRLDLQYQKIVLDLGWREKPLITAFPFRNTTNCHEPVAKHYTRLCIKEKPEIRFANFGLFFKI